MNFAAEPALFHAAPAADSHAAAVQRLCAALDAAFDACATPADPSRCAAFARTVRHALEQALAEPTLVTARQREGSDTAYCRHLIAADPEGRYAVAALVWQPGQASPVHAHRTWCGYAVLDGTLDETLYAWNAARGSAAPLRAHPRAPGAVSFVGRGRSGIHRLSNAGDTVAVSLHVYGVDAAWMATHVNDVLPLASAAMATAPDADRPQGATGHPNR